MDQPHDRDAEALRRRLYGPGATDRDLQDYLRAATPPPEPVPSPPAALVRPRSRRTRTAAVGVLLASVLAIALLVPALQERAPAPTGGAGRRVVALPTDRPDVVFADAGTVLTYRGRGSRSVPLETGLAAADGSMTVVVAPERRAEIGWRLVRTGRSSSLTTDQVLVARAGVEPASGGAPLVLAYDGAPPDRVIVSARADLAWTVVVTFVRARSAA